MSRDDGNKLKGLLLGTAAVTGGYYAARHIIHRAIKTGMGRMMTDPYSENVWEFVSAATRTGLQNIMETNLRAQKGKVIQRPLGSPRKFPRLDKLMFRTAQLSALSENPTTPVDLAVVIGPRAQKPMEISMPILISGMAFGLALSEQAKVALARGASMADTATNTGEGPFLQSERNAAKKLIIQYTKYHWHKEEEILKQADAIEIHIGQGATAGLGHRVTKKKTLDVVRKKMPVAHRDALRSDSRFANIAEQPDLLPQMVEHLREITGGVPIGAKIATGQSLEEDLQMLVDAGMDYIVLDGAEAATHGSPPITQDDFGIPTLHALCRAGKFFRKNKLKGKVTLIASGGLYSPGDFLKAIALGADAVNIGTMALFAMAHTQVLKSLPWEPPTQVVWADGKQAGKFNMKKGADSIYKYLNSASMEMADGIRALGKRSVHDVSVKDLCALDKETAEIAGVPFSGVTP